MYCRFFAAIVLALVLTSGSTAMAEQDQDKVARLRKELRKLRADLRMLRAEGTKLRSEIVRIRAEEVSAEWLDDVVVFTSPSGSEFGDAGLDNFIYYRPIVWESAGKGNRGIYAHRHTILLLEDDVEQAGVIFDNRIIGVADGSLFSSSYFDPMAEIIENKDLFPGIHDRHTEPLLTGKCIPTPIDDVETVTGDLAEHVLSRIVGFSPKTDHDIIIRLGDTMAGVRLSAGRRRMVYHREARLMLLGDESISLHGYPEVVPEGIEYKKSAQAKTDALGYLLISEIMREVTLLTHWAEWFIMSGRLGAPSARPVNPSPVTSLVREIERLFFGLHPERKKLTTWGTIKQLK